MAYIGEAVERSRSRRLAVLATVLAIGVVASACSGGSTDGASEPDSAGDSVEATTTTAAAESSATTASTDVESEDTATGEVEPTFSGDGFANPNGTTFSAETTPDEAAVMANEIAGETSDYAGALARLLPFPSLSLPADTTIATLGMGMNEFDGVITQTLTMTFDTSAPIDDVLTTFRQEAMALGGDAEGSRATIGDVDLSMFETTDEDVVKPPIFLSAHFDNLEPEALALFDGIAAAVPAIEGGRIIGAGVRYDELGGVSVRISQATNALSGDELSDTIDQRSRDIGWVFTGRRALEHHESLQVLRLGADFTGSSPAFDTFETPGDSAVAAIDLTTSPANFDPEDPFGGRDTEFVELYYPSSQ